MSFSSAEFIKSVPPWALLGVGVVTGGLRSAWDFIYKHTIGFVISKITTTIVVEDSEHPDAYLWLSQWVEAHLKQRKISSLLLRHDAKVKDQLSAEKAALEYSLIPYYGSYYMRWRNRFMMIEHWPDDASNNNGLGGRPLKKMHWIKIQVWFTRNRQAILDILQEAKEAYLADVPNYVDFYRYSTFGGWEKKRISPRSLQSVYYPPKLIDDLTVDVQNFLGNKDLYESIGIPYRRGYELDGPPGTGKSTLILAIASHFKLPVYVVSLQSEDMSADRLMDALSLCDKPCVLVFEDIDCIEAAKSRDTNTPGLNMSDLLNTLDGIGAPEGRLLFITSNNPEVLDPALTRAGRIDRKFYIDYATDAELRRFYDALSALMTLQPWEEFRAALPDKTTIADAQALAFKGNQ